jgi:hypothetical protein
MCTLGVVGYISECHEHDDTVMNLHNYFLLCNLWITLLLCNFATIASVDCISIY